MQILITDTNCNSKENETKYVVHQRQKTKKINLLQFT